MKTKSKDRKLVLYVGLMTLFLAIAIQLKQDQSLKVRTISLPKSLVLREDFYTKPPFLEKTKKPYYISVAALFEQDADTIVPWMESQRKLGVDHFFLFDHFSKDATRKHLAPYEKSGLVTLIDWPYDFETEEEKEAFQYKFRAFALEKAKPKTEWLAFLPVEHTFVTKSGSLKKDLFPFRSYGAVLLNLVPVDSGATWEKKGGYAQVQIFQPKRVARASEFIWFIPGYYPVSVAKEPLTELSLPNIHIDDLYVKTKAFDK